jgi:ribosomal-protein-alanine N-acetyltransferase
MRHGLQGLSHIGCEASCGWSQETGRVEKEPMIRRFDREDLDQILQIEAQAFPKSSYAPVVFLHYHRVSPHTFLVFEESGLWGYVIFKTDGHVISLAVDADHRRKGIGTQLIKACECLCTGKRIFVEVRKTNLAAQEFYASLGFRVISRIRLYYGTEDALVMEKALGKVMPDERLATD